MQVNPVSQQNYEPNFKATVRIKGGNLVNILANSGDSSAMTTSSASMIPSGILESTIFPMEKGGIGFAKPIRALANAIKTRWNKILGRPIKPMALEGDTTGLKEASKIASVEASSSGLVTTGVGSYTSGAASFMDQSVHYPTLGSDALPAEWIEWMRKNPLQDAAYDFLYNEKGIGNESASSFAATASGMGSVAHYAGSAGIAAPRKTLKELTSKPANDVLS